MNNTTDIDFDSDIDEEQSIPSKDVLVFGDYHIPADYRSELYKYASFYTAEEIVGTFIGHDPVFPSYSKWNDTQNKVLCNDEESDGESDEESEEKPQATSFNQYNVTYDCPCIGGCGTMTNGSQYCCKFYCPFEEIDEEEEQKEEDGDKMEHQSNL